MNELYQRTVPTFIKLLGGLKNVLGKAEAYVREKGMSEEELLKISLVPDMFPLVKQVQVACDQAKGAVARLAGVEIPKFDDTEATIAELVARIDKTLEFIQSVPEASFTDAATRQITLPYHPGQYMTGEDYAKIHVVPNFTFHVVTAYGLVRHAGVPVGKDDYLNGRPLKDL